MKILIVAHPDDEILWFNSQSFDKIIICFSNDNYEKALKNHPLTSKIKCLKLTESNYYKNKFNYDKHLDNYKILKDSLKEDIEKATIIYTHNPWGEYNHADHILVNQVVTELTRIHSHIKVFAWDGIMFNPEFGFVPIIGRETYPEKIDLDFFRKIKALYIHEGIWNWVINYEPKQEQCYFQI